MLSPARAENPSLNHTDQSWKNFLHYVLPSAAAMVLFSSYTIIDGIFVAKGVSDLAMAAVNLSLPFVNVLSGIAILLSMGASTLVAFALGKGDRAKANELFTQTVVLIVILSAAITLAVCLWTEPLARLLGAGPLTMGYATQYLHVVCLFSVCFILSYCLEVMVKIDGRPQLAVIGVGISFVIHIGLDYVFIFLMDMEVLGSALATGLAQLASLVFFLIYFLSGKSTLRFRKFRFDWIALRDSLPLGVADCSIEFMLAFLTMLYNRVISATMGEEYLPLYAVIAYISLLVSMVMQGIAQGMMPLVSLAVGQGDRRGAQKFLVKCLICVAVTALAVEVVCQAAPGLLVSLLLEEDNGLFAQAVSALRQYAASYPFAGICIALAGYFAALGKGFSSMLLSLGRGFLFLPGALLLFSTLGGGLSIWMAALAGELISLILGLFLLGKHLA